MVGKDKVVVPDANSSEEDWAAFYRKAGLPESIDTYELSAPEGLYQLLQQLNGIFFIPLASVILAGFFLKNEILKIYEYTLGPIV